jgi:hypothetical protein
MATSKGAFISVDQIVYAWLLRNGKTIHAYWKALPLAAEAVRELSLSSIQLMVQHKILTRPKGQTWFELPGDYTDYVSAGIRQGGWWRPLGISNRLIPLPRMTGTGEYDGSEFSGSTWDFNTKGEWTNWVNPQNFQSPASFWAGNYSSQNYQTSTGGSSGGGDISGIYPGGLIPYGGAYPYFWSDWYNDWGELLGRRYGLGDGYRPDVVAINPEQGVIMIPNGFPSHEMYLVYVGLGTVDTMTHIPIKAQAAVEAYIDWKYHANKRNVSRSESADWERKWHEQHRILRARTYALSAVDIKLIASRYYGQTQSIP